MLSLRKDRKLFLPYVTGGVVPQWTDHLLALQDAGADAIEVGLPFSDPMLDGAVVQRASDQAIARGATVDAILADLDRIRGDLRVPLIAFTYTNLVERRGADRFCAMLREHGFGGLILPDLPVDEAGPVLAAAGDLDLVQLAAPATPPDRLERICATSRGFVYAVSVMGVTGERDTLTAEAYGLAGRLKALTDLPVLLGFGISGREQARQAGAVADGVAVGAAVMRRILDGATPADLGTLATEIRAGLDSAQV
ncbi:tryptophan synthase subunit alpha [Hamadaea tsunoensis]|uniref:tryptophan synthase subunit alpha n=1 Tax=Hamadaea tsunoensis TaxID=53368 RepID=UPI0003FD9BB4|nr:tryptophan synthase subunit alpha [Hamadaea tsunoensis]